MTGGRLLPVATDRRTTPPVEACADADGFWAVTVPGAPEPATGSVSATKPAASTWPAALAMSSPATLGTVAWAGLAAVVVDAVVAVVVIRGAAASAWPFETCSVTVWPFATREPPPGFCSTTIPRGRDDGPTISCTLSPSPVSVETACRCGCPTTAGTTLP